LAILFLSALLLPPPSDAAFLLPLAVPSSFDLVYSTHSIHLRSFFDARADLHPQLPRTIFAIQDEPPTWPGADDDDDMGPESISDPEEIEDAGSDGDMSSASHAPLSNASHGDAASSASHVATSSFAHTHAHHNSNFTTHSASTASSGKTRSEVDTEEDPVAPITPLPGAHFDLSGAPPPAPAGKDKGTVGDAYAELEGDDGFVDASGDMKIEDDWVDPVAPPPAPVAKKVSKKGKGKRKTAVPVPSVHYPFPVSVEDCAGVPASPSQRARERIVTVSPRAGGAGVGGQRMHTARARDGGRTQSGGVRGVLTED
jgi:cysteine protease ATG4